MSFVQFCPLSAHGAKSSVATPSCVAPPAASIAAVALPCWIFNTRPLLVVVAFGTRHTLASYLSMHTVPDTTASGAHPVRGWAPCAPAVPASSSSAADIVMPRLAWDLLGIPARFMTRPPLELVLSLGIAGRFRVPQTSRSRGVNSGHPPGRVN